MADPAPRLYRFEPLDTSGIFLGLGVVQCAVLAIGVLLGVATVTSGASVLVAVVPPAAACAVAFGRVRGLRMWEHLLVAVGWLMRRVLFGRRWLAPLPLVPTASGAPAPMPPWLDGIDVVELPWRGTIAMGVVRDRSRHTLTALVRVVGPQFVVRPRAEQEQLLAGWGELLSQFAVERGAVVHLAWSDFAVFCPVSAHQSRRRIERDLVKLETDATAKEEKGRRVDARHRRATQALLDREQELVAGFAEMGYVGLVTVTASSLEELEDHAELLEQLARESGMELRLLVARQDVAWAAGLPIGLAPRTLLS